MLDCWGELSAEGFNMNIYIELDGESKEFRIQYESSDGTHYTRTRFESGGEPLENPVDLTTLVKWGSRWGEAQWNDLIGYFMIVGSTSYEGLYEYNGTNTQYELANIQLNATSEDVYGDKALYTNIGKINGSLQNTTNLTLDQLRTRINLYNDLSYLELNENITNMNQAFSSYSSSSIPNINTINVTNMSGMFYNCINLTTVSNFNTSNVTNMSYMLRNCNNLTTVPNFNTINVSDISNMFQECFNLISVPNFNTNNVTNMSGMFYYCNNLVSVPELNTSKVTNMNYIFAQCVNLSNESYANIANMLPLASNIVTPRLSSLGLNAGKFTPEQQNILYDKGYIDAIWDINNWSTIYNVYYT